MRVSRELNEVNLRTKKKENHLFEIHCIQLIDDLIYSDFHRMNDERNYVHHRIDHREAFLKQFEVINVYQLPENEIVKN